MISERQKRILKLIVEEYVKTVEPVGSKTISNHKDFDYSSATIRNDMAELENQGYLLKTHTSSGRVPSEKGYKMYVNMMLEEEKKHKKENRFPMIDEIFEKNMLSQEQAIKESMALVSELTNYTALALGSSAYNARIRKIQLVSLEDNLAVIILVTNQGYVESKKIIVPDTINAKDIQKVINLLNELLYDCPVGDIDVVLQEKLANSTILEERLAYYDQLIGVFVRAIGNMVEDKYYLSGQSNIMKQPEFRDVDKLHGIMKAMEEKEVLKLINLGNDTITVQIGEENRISAMKDCTIISVPYEDKEGTRGALAVIGPKRMEYSKVIPLLEYIAKNMHKL